MLKAEVKSEEPKRRQELASFRKRESPLD